MALDNTYQPPVTYPIRPLNKGMLRNLPSNGLPEGSYLRLQNYRVHEYGLKRRGGFIPFNTNAGTTEPTTYDEQLLDLIYYWSSAASPEMLLLGDSHLMKLESGGSVTKKYANVSTPEDTYTITSVGTYNSATYSYAITLTCTEEQSDRMYVGSDFFWDDGTEYFLGNVSNSTFTTDHVDLIVVIPGTVEPTNYPTTADVAIVRETFVVTDNMDVTFAVVPPATYADVGKVIFADQGGNGLYSYESGVLDTYTLESSVDGQPTSTQYVDSGNVLTYFEDRIWIGNTLEQGQRFPQRVRWSDPINFSRFQPVNYVDLPYSDGELIAMKPLGPLLVVYFTDAIYIGRPTNMAGRPYQFEKLETGAMGLITQRALVKWNDSHIFVGTDNIYRLSMNAALEPIGSPLLEETLEETKRLILENYIQIEHDPKQESLVFLFPNVVENGLVSNSLSTRLWRLNYKSLGWSYDEVYFNDPAKTSAQFYFTGLLSARVYNSGRTWEDWQGSDSENDESAVWAWMPLMSADPTERAETYNLDTMTATDPDDDIEDSSVTDSFWNAESWDQLKSETIQAKKLYIPIWRMSSETQVILEESDTEFDNLGEATVLEDDTTYIVWSVIESMDYDFGAPDQTKTVTRFGCKLFDNQMGEFADETKTILEELNFQLFMSDSMGYRWKRPVNFRFKRDYNEGYANILATGSTFRYKLVNGQEILPYKLSEMTLRVVGRGLQTNN